MKKTVLRVFLLILALLTVIPFAGCESAPSSQDTDPATAPSTEPATDPTDIEPTETEPATEPEDGPDLPELNFGGREFTMLLRNEEAFLRDTYVAELGDTSSSMDRAVYQRLTDISHDYDLVFDVVLDKNTNAKVAENAKAGTDIFDLVMDHGYNALGNVFNVYYYNCRNLPHNNLDAAWWNQDAIKEFSSIAGNLYVLFGDISYMSVGSAFCMFFNKSLLADVGLISPYELVRTNEWTFETFEEYVLTMDANMDGDGTGSQETDSFGYGTSTWRGPLQILYSTGRRILTRRNDDWVFALDTDMTNAAAFDMRELVRDSGAVTLSKTNFYPEIKKAFIEKRLAFMDGQVDESRLFTGEDLNFGIVPWPKYTAKVQNFAAAVDGGANLYGVMRNTSSENLECISVVLEAMAYRGHKEIMPLYFDTILSYQYLKDEESIEMLHIIHENLIIDQGYFRSPAASLFPNAVTAEDAGSVSTELAEIEESALLEIYLRWQLLDDMEAGGF